MVLAPRRFGKEGNLEDSKVITIYNRLKRQKGLHGLTLYTATGVKETNGFDRSHPYLILTTRKGESLLRDYTFFKQLEVDFRAFTGAQDVLGGASGETYRVPYNGDVLFIKRRYDWGRAPFEFMGAQLLAEQGIHVSPLVLATNTYFVTEEVPGAPLGTSEWVLSERERARFKQYHSEVERIGEQLEERGLWIPKQGSMAYFRSIKAEHLFPRDLDSQNPLDWYTVIDPVDWSSDWPF